jgi:hypothetical protein
MSIRTLAIAVSAPRDTVFNFLADIENLPRWAHEFCERLYLERGRWKALTSQGELFCDLEAGAATGVIDLRLGPSPEKLDLLPLRVVALSPRRTLVTLAFIAGPDWPGGLAVRNPAEVETELQGLVRRFGGGEVYSPDAGLLVLGRN